MQSHEIARSEWLDAGENWHAVYFVDGLRVPLFVHKSIVEHYAYGSDEFWAYIERSAVAAAESWKAHPEWRVN